MFGLGMENKIRELIRELKDDIAKKGNKISEMEKDIKQLKCGHSITKRRIEYDAWDGGNVEFCEECNKRFDSYFFSSEARVRRLEIAEEVVRQLKGKGGKKCR